MKTPKETVEKIQEDIMMEGLNHYQASCHSELYLDEFSKMKANEAGKYFMEMLEIDECIDCWIATVLDALCDNKEQYGLSDEWFDEICKHEKLRIF
jgi:hypothetical protein